MCINACLCVRTFLLLLLLSCPVCFHRNAGADPGVGERQRCVCDPDSVQVRKKTRVIDHFNTLFP